jgi:hypothetical protein
MSFVDPLEAEDVHFRIEISSQSQPQPHVSEFVVSGAILEASDLPVEETIKITMDSYLEALTSLYVHFLRTVRGSRPVATIQRPTDYEALIHKPVLVRQTIVDGMSAKGEWTARTLIEIDKTKDWTYFDGQEYWAECRPYDAALVGKVTDD